MAVTLDATENGLWVEGNGRAHFIAKSVLTHQTILETIQELNK